MWVQTVWLVAAFVVVGLSQTFFAAAVAGVALSTWWLCLNVLYARALVREPQNADEPRLWRARSRWRYERDHHVAVQILVSSIAAVAATVLGAADVQISESRSFSLLAVADLTLALGVYASSLVDWYYIRPRLDGLVREPPCRASRGDACMHLTRAWYAHRSVAELLGITSLSVGLVALCLWLIPGASNQALEVSLGVVAALAGLLAALVGGAVDTVRHRAIDPPDHWLGDELHQGSPPGRYLLHVDVRNVIVRREEADGWGAKKGIPHNQLGWDVESARFRRCLAAPGGCSQVNPDCERGLRLSGEPFDDPRPPRVLVL